MSSDDPKSLTRIGSTAIIRTGRNELASRALKDLGLLLKAGPVEYLGTVFVVDDEQPVREILCHWLRGMGYQCRSFSGGPALLAAIASGEKCDLLTQDLMNPCMDGITLLTEIKTNYSDIAVIVATCVKDESVRQVCEDWGAFYLPHPFERSELLAVVSRALAEAWSKKGNILDAKEMYPEALKFHEKAISIDPSCVLAWINLGLNLDLCGRLEEAIRSYEKAYELDTTSSRPLVLKGELLDRLGRSEEAIPFFDAALVINSQSFSGWEFRGAALRKLARFEEALESYEKLFSLDRDTFTDAGRRHNQSFALNQKGVTFVWMGRYHEAIDCYERAIELVPNAPESFFNIGNVYWRQKRYLEAIRWYDKSLECYGQYSASWNNKGLCLAHLGRAEEALHCYDKAVSCPHPEVLGWNNKANLQQDLGLVRDAIESYEKFLQVAASNPEHSGQVQYARERLRIIKDGPEAE